MSGSTQEEGRRYWGASLSSGQEGDISDGSVTSRPNSGRRSGVDGNFSTLQLRQFSAASMDIPTWESRQPSARHTPRSTQRASSSPAQSDDVNMSEEGYIGASSPASGRRGHFGGQTEAGFDDGAGVEFAEPRRQTSTDAKCRTEASEDWKGSGDVGHSPRSPLGHGQRVVVQMDKASMTFEASQHESADATSSHASPDSRGGSMNRQLRLQEDAIIAAGIPSSGEESTSTRKEGYTWQGAGSPRAPCRGGSRTEIERAVDARGGEDEVLRLQKALGLTEASARRWKVAATSADAQARGFQVALAATEQTMQTLNDRHVGEFAAAWARIRDMEKGMAETVQEHVTQVTALQNKLAAKEKEAATSQQRAEVLERVEVEQQALITALQTARDELERVRTAGDANEVHEDSIRRLEQELAGARAETARRETKKDEEMQTRLAEAEEALTGAKHEARDALQQAERQWQDILAKRDAKSVSELEAKEQELRESVAVAEKRERQVVALQQEVCDLQGGASEVEWMRERMGAFERDVIEEVSDLSRALEEKDEVVVGLQTALETARVALVEAEENLRKEDERHRKKAAAKARDFAAELSEVEDLYRLELQRKEGQMRALETEVTSARNDSAAQADLAERLGKELAEERNRNEVRMAKVAGEIVGLRARVANAESAGKVAAALQSELDECRGECNMLREKYSNHQLESVELEQMLAAAQQQLELEGKRTAAVEVELRKRFQEVEIELRGLRAENKGLQNALGEVNDALGIAGDPVEGAAGLRKLRGEADHLRNSLADALSQVEAFNGMEEQVTAKSERMKELRKALSEAREALRELEQEREVEKEGLREEVRTALEQARAERDGREKAETESFAQSEELLRSLRGAERTLGECQRELQSEQALRKAAEERNAENGAEVLKVVNGYEEKLEERGRLVGQVASLQCTLEEEKRRHLEAQKSGKALERRVAEVESQLVIAEAQREGRAGQVAILEGQLRERSEGLRQTLEELQGQAEAKQATIDGLSGELTKLTSNLERVTLELQQVASELETAKQQLEEKDEELAVVVQKSEERLAEASTLAQELQREQERSERLSQGMKKHVEAAADEYQRAKAAVKAELERVNQVLEQERIASSIAIRDAQQSHQDAEDRCETLDYDLRTVHQTLNLRTSEVTGLREQLARAEAETTAARQRVSDVEEGMTSQQDDLERVAGEARQKGVEIEKLRKGVRLKERVITGLEERLQAAVEKLAVQEKQTAAAGKDVERERRGRKEWARKAEAAVAAAEKSALEKGEVERRLADVGKSLERLQNRNDSLEGELGKGEKKRRDLVVAAEAAVAANAPLRAKLNEAESLLATSRNEAGAAKRVLDERVKSLEVLLAESERGRLEATAAQSAAQREREEALGGLQEAVALVDAAVAQKEQATRGLEAARREVIEATERAGQAAKEAALAAEERRAAIEEKDATLVAVEDVLASVERERANLFAMARAAAAELAHEMKKVKGREQSLGQTPPLEPFYSAPLWSSGCLVKQYLASDLAERPKATALAGIDWVPEKRLEPWGRLDEAIPRGGREAVETAEKATNTDSIVIDQGGVLVDRSPNAIRPTVPVDNVTVYTQTGALVLNTAPERLEHAAGLQMQVAAADHKLELVLAAHQDRVSSLESQLACSQRAFEAVQSRNQELEEAVKAHAGHVQELEREMTDARTVQDSQFSQVEATHSAEVGRLQQQLCDAHEQLTSMEEKLTAERSRAGSAVVQSVEAFFLSGHVRAWREERLMTSAVDVEEEEPSGAGLGGAECSPSIDNDGVQEGSPSTAQVRGVSRREGVGGVDGRLGGVGEAGTNQGQLRALSGLSPAVTPVSETKGGEASKPLEVLAQAETGKVDVTSPEKPTHAAEPADVGDRVSRERVLLSELDSARAEVVRLSEELRVCGCERKETEEGLKRAFADELRIAAERIESARAEFASQVEQLESEADAKLAEVQDTLDKERSEIARLQGEALAVEKRETASLASRVTALHLELDSEREEAEKLRAGVSESKDRVKDREKELLTLGAQYGDAMQLANEMRESALAAEQSRQEMCVELERAVQKMREQQEVLEMLQQRLQAAQAVKSFAGRHAGASETDGESEGGDKGKGRTGGGGVLRADGVDERVAALDQVIDMWRTACRQKDIEIATLRAALDTTQALLADSEERLAQLRTDFQRLDLANEDTCSELDRRMAEMAIATKQLLTALQAANHPPAEARADAELAEEGQLAQAAMAAAAVIGMEAREKTRMAEKVEILQKMQGTPGTADRPGGVSNSVSRIRTPARKPVWLDRENRVVRTGKRIGERTLEVDSGESTNLDERALASILV